VYQHILIPTDGSEVAEKAVAAGIDFARQSGARVTLFTAVPEYQPPNEGEIRAGNIVSVAEFDRQSEARAKEILSGAERQARQAKLEFDLDFAQSNHPWRAII
jgi:nucleotide-binding universal stress UspA family protein